MVSQKNYHRNNQKESNRKDKSELKVIVLLRNVLEQFNATLRICMLDQVSPEFLFTDSDFQHVSFIKRHIPRAFKYDLED